MITQRRHAMFLCMSIAVLLGLAGMRSVALAARHLELKSSSPAEGATIPVGPATLRLVFTAPVVRSLCKIVLVSPGSEAGVSLLLQTENADSVLVATVPGELESGSWSAKWVAAGADGHALQGSLSFVVSQTSTSSSPDSSSAPPPASPSAIANPQDSVSAQPTLSFARLVYGRLGRLAVYGALFIAIGAFGISAMIVPRLRRDALVSTDAFPTMLDGMAQSVGVVAGFMLVLSTAIRTLLQFGESRSMGAIVSLWDFLTVTGVGRELAASTLLGGVVAMSSAMARQHRSSMFWRIVQTLSLIGFLFFWASSGHAASSSSLLGMSAVFPLMLHILSAALWTGTLSVLFVTALPVVLRDRTRLPALRATLTAFTPVAVTAAAVMILSGLLNALAQVKSVSALTSTTYGQLLMSKSAVVLVLLLVGLYNWRVVARGVNDIAGALRMRTTIRWELLLAIVALIITSILVAVPPAHWGTPQ